jgi:predicted nucleic acid-binding protein
MFVIDASVALGWFVPDEEPLQDFLDLVLKERAVVPVMWPIEIGNALLVAVRRGRMTSAQRAHALQQLQLLPIERDAETLSYVWTSAMALADRFALTLYDACYLELAARRGLALASLDRELSAAAERHGVSLLKR